MAIEQNISIAVGFQSGDLVPSEDRNESGQLSFKQVNLSNVDLSLYPECSFRDASALNSLDKPEWHHYIICGYKGILEEAEANEAFVSRDLVQVARRVLPSYALNLVVSGDIPHSAGLSSSSALVVASSIAFRYALGSILSEHLKSDQTADPNLQSSVDRILRVDKLEMASSCARFERAIGTQGGGIDQAIQLLAEVGTAKLIKFKPKLGAFNVELPKECEFFVLHCGRTLNKASTIHYNVRVFETRVAAALLKKHRSELACEQKKVLLSDFETHDKENPYFDLIEQVTDLFRASGGRLTINEIQELLQADSLEGLGERIQFPVKSLNLIREAHGNEFKFNLLDRALHVYGEVNRVLKMSAIDPNADNQRSLRLAGQLLNESHESLKRMYECSCDELDRLVELSNRSGAVGAKLTGAGWAGCIVAIVPKENAEEYERCLSEHSKFLIRTKPNQGAVIYAFNN